ncbi:MAG: helix-turn-helix domain-containing protein [Mogibacterium sp.]|nr:helix-turn-helix domain-containing protein [Mogibacterium sp.]
MDQVKIGRYIAEKRKEKELTQEQLAEKVGKSRKAVSKWERGLCLPDVSVYTELCELLGISLNEFFAGEDIELVDVVERSEKNLLGVAQDGSKRSGRLKKIVLLVSLIAVVLGCLLFWFMSSEGFFATNYVKPYASNTRVSVVTKSLTDGFPIIYEYKVDDKYTYAEIGIHKFVDGKEIETDYGDLRHMTEGEPGEGLITLVPDHNNSSVRLALSSEFSSLSTEIDILSELEERPHEDEFVDSVAGGGLPNDGVKVKDGKEIPIGVYYVSLDDEADLSYPGCSETYEHTVASIKEAKIPYAFLFTVKFGAD